MSRSTCPAVHVLQYMSASMLYIITAMNPPSLHSVLYLFNPTLPYSFLPHIPSSASFTGDVAVDYSIDPGGYPPIIGLTKSSNYDQKLRANSKSELPQRRRESDESKDDSQIKLSSLSTDLTSCRGIGEHCTCYCRFNCWSAVMFTFSQLLFDFSFIHLTQ
jgi:hypothetical protein